MRVCEVLLGVAQAQKVYERAGRYTPEGMPEIMSGVYEDEGYAVPYMWAAILIYALWPSMIKHIAMFEMSFEAISSKTRLSLSWLQDTVS